MWRQIDVRIVYALTAGALIAGSAATLALAQAGTGAAPQVAAQTMYAAPGGAPQSFADLTAKLLPAVVNVSTTQKVEVNRFSGITPGSPLEELFKKFQEQQGGGAPGQGGPAPVTREATSLGSGFIISSDGYVVTNNHVVSGKGGDTPVDTITVILADRREYTAKLIGRDTLADLALLKIDAKDLPFVAFGDSSKARVGDWAIAIGNPFGLGGTVTAGIVSALHRNIQSGSAYDRYIQTDASINQGNSGGPLFDLNGNVIGINTIIFTPSGGNIGLGFSIPAEIAKPVIDQLRANGKVRRGYLGVSIQPLSDNIAAGLGLPKDKGEIVANVEAGGPASRAGVKQGDVILKVADQEVAFDNTLQFIVSNTPIGTTVPIEIVRGGKKQVLRATVGERPSDKVLAARLGGGDPDESADATDKPDVETLEAGLGIKLSVLTAKIRGELRLQETVQGVVIASVSPSSDAAAQGLQRGDVILSINQVPTTTPMAAARAIADARKAGRETVLLLFQRGPNPPGFIGVKLAAEVAPAKK